MNPVHERELTLDEKLTRLQHQSFGYFVHEWNPANGLVPDKTSRDWPASIAAVGMALTCFPIGVERGFMTRDEAVRRTLTTLRFFASTEQSDSPTASGYRGFYYHFLDMQTGARAWQCELSSIDTALLMAGMLTAAAFYQGHDPAETEIRTLADMLYQRVDWDWMRSNRQTVCHGWKPETGFLPFHWEGYDEALVLYLLGLGSPTHPLPISSYEAWCSTYVWREVEGIEHLHAGPLFIHQMSHVWVDFRGIRDQAMRDHDSDYFINSKLGTEAQQRYAIRNPLGHALYGELCWGVTASDGPGGASWRQPPPARGVFFDYVARGIPDGPDDGTLAPWAVVASLPFAPDIVLPTIHNFHLMQLHVANPYGFKASFNPSYPHDGHHDMGWASPYHFGINEGPTVIMIENHRSQLIWRLSHECPYLRAGLVKAGFTGGWLDAVIPSAAPTAV